MAGVGLRLVTALLLAVMFALVKLAATRGVNLVESLFYRQCGSALCAVGTGGRRAGLCVPPDAPRWRPCRPHGAWHGGDGAQFLGDDPASAGRSHDHRIFGADLLGGAGRPRSWGADRQVALGSGRGRVHRRAADRPARNGRSAAVRRIGGAGRGAAHRLGDHRHSAAGGDRESIDHGFLVRGQLAGSARPVDAVVRRDSRSR